MAADDKPQDKKDKAAPGTGGLSLEPPPGGPDESLAIGFAPDLTDELPFAATTEAVPTPVAGLGPTARPGASRAPAARRYPLAEATLDRLLGPPAAPAPASLDEPLQEFAIGAGIMRPPAAIVQEPPPPPPPGPAETAAQGHIEDMVEVVLVGKPEGGRSEIHLLFKEDVLRGLYLILEKRDDGLFARFTVGDDTARRAVLGRVDELVARLRGRGMTIAGYDVVVKEAD